jgi:Uma2 family endonuclease
MTVFSNPVLTELDLARLPDDGYRHELRAGLVLAEPRPFPLHARIQARVIELLAGFARAEALGPVLGDAGFVLARDPDTVRGPDVVFVCRERWDAVTNKERFFPGAPDLAVEILASSNRTAEIQTKIADYLAAGARLVWIVDPADRSVTVYRPPVPPRRLASDEPLDGAEVLPGLSIRAAALFEP